MNTGCLKIYKKAAQFDEYGGFIPPHRRGDDIQLFRGLRINARFNNGQCLTPVFRMFPGGCA